MDASSTWTFSNLSELHSLFGWEEYLVLSAVLFVSVLIGIYFAYKGQKSTNEFLMASRQMGLFPTTMSISCSFISAVTMLGTPAEMYVFGTQYWVIGLAYPFVLAATGHIYMPVFHRMGPKTKSVHDYLERRFNRTVRLFASTCFIILTCLYMAIVVYAPALALAQVTGLNTDLTIGLTFVVCIIYTSLGGLKAVIWTNVFQAACMFLSSLIVVIVGDVAVGGSEVVFRRSYETKRIELFNLDPSILIRHTFWSQVVGGYFTWMTIYGINQTMYQRYLSVPSMKMARQAIWLSGLSITIILSIVSYAGLVIYARYYDCDPISSKLVSTKDQLLPLFVMDLMGNMTGFPGFFVAGIFSGALSTVSGGLNSLAAVTLEDFILLLYPRAISDERATTITKYLALGYGILSYILIFLVKNIPGLVQAWLGIFGVLGGPVLGIFSLGMFLPWANSRGALTGGITSLLFILWCAIGGNLSRLSGITVYEEKVVSVAGCPAEWNATLHTGSSTTLNTVHGLEWWYHLPIYDLSYMWYSGVACLVTLCVGSVSSLIWRGGSERDKVVDPDLLAPGIETLFCCWPKRCRNWLGKNRYVATRQHDEFELHQ